MPTFIQAFARILPLTYLNNGLREIMVYGNYQAALWNCSIVFAIGIVAIAISMKVTRLTDL